MRNIEVKVSKVEGRDGRLIGYADVVIDKSLAIHRIRIIEKDGRRFIAFPSIRKYNSEKESYDYADVVHPINPDVRKEFEDLIFAEFDKLVD